ELYLRLAEVYETCLNPGGGTRPQFLMGSIPAFSGPIHWLNTFLVELSKAGTQREAIFPADLIQAMIVANSQDPIVLVRGSFFYDDSQGKSQISRWVNRPYTYFQCLKGFPEIVLNSLDAVRPALQQKDA